MKKIITIFSAFLFLFTLAACQAKPAKKAAPKVAVELVLKEDGKTFSHKTVKVAKHATVAKALKTGYSAKIEKGIVTAIDHRQQAPKQNRYWLYTVNGKVASKGVNDLKVAKKDRIVFNLAAVKTN